MYVGFWYRDYVSQLPCVGYYVLLGAVLNILVRNARSGECDVVPLYGFIALLMDMFVLCVARL